MASPSNPPPGPPPPPPGRNPLSFQKGQIPPEVIEILGPSIQIGLGAGTAGLFVGAASGIVRSAAPVLFSLVTGAQWFALGSSYYASRRAAIMSWGGDGAVSPADKVKASTLAGASAGFVGGVLRGPRNILPAIAMFSLFGAGGQAIANVLPASEDGTEGHKASGLPKWVPLKAMSDEEYKKFVDEKILQLDAEISLIDDKIASLKASKDHKTAQSTEDSQKQ